MTTQTNQRIERLRARLGEENLDGLLLTKPENRRYFSRFSGQDSGSDSAGTLLVTLNEVVLITDLRYAEWAAAETTGLTVAVRAVGQKWVECASDVIRARQIARLGFESEHLTVRLHDDLAEKIAGVTELVPTTAIGDGLRAIKDAAEVALTRQAVQFTDEAFAHFLSIARAGRTERQLAWEIECFLRESGADGLAFEVSVAGGPHAAMPHARISDRPLQPGDPVILDMGAQVGGYAADLTRSVLVGGGSAEQEARFRKVFAVVRAANQAVAEGLRAGLSGVDGDSIARTLIADAGFGDQFTHGLGHGVGLEIHEKPSLGKSSEDTLAVGMLVTNEPGIYIEGWGGVRIEDLLLIHDDRAEVLSHSSRDICII